MWEWREGGQVWMCREKKGEALKSQSLGCCRVSEGSLTYVSDGCRSSPTPHPHPHPHQIMFLSFLEKLRGLCDGRRIRIHCLHNLLSSKPFPKARGYGRLSAHYLLIDLRGRLPFVILITRTILIIRPGSAAKVWMK